jgi:hypothetical protein
MINESTVYALCNAPPFQALFSEAFFLPLYENT